MEWFPLVIEALGGGIPAVLIIALGWLYFKERQETKVLYQKFLTVIEENTKAFYSLASKIEHIKD